MSPCGATFQGSTGARLQDCLVTNGGAVRTSDRDNKQAMTTRTSPVPMSSGSRGEESARQRSVPLDSWLVHPPPASRRFMLAVLLGGGCALFVALGFWFLHRRPIASTKVEPNAEPATLASRDYPSALVPSYQPPSMGRSLSELGSNEARTAGAEPNGDAPPNVAPEVAARLGADEALKKLEASGPAAADSSASAWKIVEHWKGIASAVGTEFTDFRCFKNGCAVTSTHQDLSAATSAGDDILRPDHFAWPGQAFRSGPLHDPSGRVRFVWILYATD